MKYFIFLFFLIGATSHAQVPRAEDLKIVTTFKGFTCRAFEAKVDAPDRFRELGVIPTKLGISESLTRILIDFTSEDSCHYTVELSRERGEKLLVFEESFITGPQQCEDLKTELDEITMPGFRYAIKFNAIAAVLFLKEGLTGPCTDDTDLTIGEFEWDLQ